MPKNIFYFTNSSIGDFLMVSSLMEDIHRDLKDSNLYIIISRNEKTFLEFVQIYSVFKYVHILNVGTGNRRGIIGFYKLLKSFFSINYVVTSPTRGRIPLKLKIFAKLISLRKGSMLVGFDDGAQINHRLYNKLIKYNDKISFYDLLLKLFDEFKIKKTKTFPSLEDCSLAGVIEKHRLEKNKYIVVHPLGSNDNKSILGDNLFWLIKKIKDDCGLKIVVTGSREDYQTIEKINVNFKQGEVMNLCGKPSMGEIHTLVEGARFFVGVNTGIAHIASFAQKKSFIISNYYPSNWLPYYNKNAVIIYNEGHTEGLNDFGKEALLGVSRNAISEEFEKFIFKLGLFFGVV